MKQDLLKNAGLLKEEKTQVTNWKEYNKTQVKLLQKFSIQELQDKKDKILQARKFLKNAGATMGMTFSQSLAYVNADVRNIDEAIAMKNKEEKTK